MKITVVTPCYNHEKYLKQAIESVLKQSFPVYEYLLINDGSTDNSLKIMKEYQKNNVFVIDLLKQKSVANVLNYSIKIMKGDIWMWVPADDILEENCLEEKLKVHDGSVWYSCWTHIDENDNKIGEYSPPFKTPEEFRKLIWEKCEIGFTGIWIPKAVFNKVGGFPTEYPCSEDYAWMLKASKREIDFKCLYQKLYRKRLHNNRMTARNGRNILEVVKTIRKDLKNWR